MSTSTNPGLKIACLPQGTYAIHYYGDAAGTWVARADAVALLEQIREQGLDCLRDPARTRQSLHLGHPKS